MIGHQLLIGRSFRVMIPAFDGDLNPTPTPHKSPLRASLPRSVAFMCFANIHARADQLRMPPQGTKDVASVIEKVSTRAKRHAAGRGKQPLHIVSGSPRLEAVGCEFL